MGQPVGIFSENKNTSITDEANRSDLGEINIK
jgi:hypothetical protein